jgi:hypothetical protein
LRHINDLRIDRLDYIDRLAGRLLHYDLLLRSGLQGARSIGLVAQALDRGGDCSLIGRKGRADRGIVVDVLSHHVEHARKIHQRNERRIKSLLLRCIR